MKHKDIIILKKILDYCQQVDDACTMFENDFQRFVELCFANILYQFSILFCKIREYYAHLTMA